MSNTQTTPQAQGTPTTTPQALILYCLRCIIVKTFTFKNNFNASVFVG